MEILFEKLTNLIECNTDLIRVILKDSYSELPENVSSLGKLAKEAKALGKYEKKLTEKIEEVISGAEYDIEIFINCTLQYKRGRFPTTLPQYMLLLALNVRQTAKNIDIMAQVVKKFQHNGSEPDLSPLEEIKITRRSQLKRKGFRMKEDRMVGFGWELNVLFELLNGGSDERETISIYGMHGIGKTTLSKRLFNDPRIELLFRHRVFISVSPEHRWKDILVEVLEAIDPLKKGSFISASDKELIKLLGSCLERARYLIVLDDVRETKVWDDLKHAFPDEKNRSRVIITTQVESLAWHANPKSNPFHLRLLYLDESRELFRREVFGEFHIPIELERYEFQILEGCCGLPLAVAQVAGFLRNETQNLNTWRQVAGQLEDYISLGPKGKIDMLRWCFSQLPPYLQYCFLYLGIFPEVSEIPVRDLLQLWIAEDLIQQNGNVSLEDVAEGYLEELVRRNLLMVGRKKSNGKIKTCRINPTVRKFCKMQAGNIDLFKEIEGSKTNLLLHSCNRLCINSDLLEEYLLGEPQGKTTNSLLCFLKGELVMRPGLISLLAKAFQHLMVLDARPISFSEFPRDILDLCQLKYLAVAGCFKFLPQNFSTLSNLQTLIVETSTSTLEIKADILKMNGLRHVYVNTSTSLKVEEDPSVNTSMQTLSSISPETCKGVLERTPQLKKLCVRGKLATLLEPYSWSDGISKLEVLESLKLLNDDATSNLYVLPSENKFPRMLKKLTLINTMLEWKNMTILGKLEYLEVLKLKKNAFRGQLWKSEDGGFRSLKVLHIETEDLVVWRASASHFPVLTCLFLRHCTNLDSIPRDLAYISTIQMIDLYYINCKVVSSCKKIAQLKLLIQQDIYQRNAYNSGFMLSVYPPKDVMSSNREAHDAPLTVPSTGAESQSNVQREGWKWRRGKKMLIGSKSQANHTGLSGSAK